jgi:hypothetical protein
MPVRAPIGVTWVKDPLVDGQIARETATASHPHTPWGERVACRVLVASALHQIRRWRDSGDRI